MPKPQPEAGRRVLRELERLGQRTGRSVQQRLAQLDVTDLEVHVLWHLRNDGRTPAELLRAFGIQPSTLTGVLDRLEARRLIRRSRHPTDRRSVLLVLTPAGHRWPLPSTKSSMPDHGFRNLWLATSVSQVGTQVSELAIPFIAVTTLRAAPFEIGVLNAVQFLPILLLSLVVGVWVDRLRRRPVLIASDLARALILFSIPLAAIWHVLSLPQLYVVGFLVGSFTVLFDVAYQSYLPAVVA